MPGAITLELLLHVLGNQSDSSWNVWWASLKKNFTGKHAKSLEGVQTEGEVQMGVYGGYEAFRESLCTCRGHAGRKTWKERFLYWLPASHWGGWMISVLTTWTGRERKTSCWHEWLMEKRRMETLLGLNRWHAVLHGSCLPSCGISWIQSHARNQPSASYNRWMTYCSLTRNRQNKHISVAGPTSSS